MPVLPDWIKVGVRFRLIEMGPDPCPIPPGSTGTITHIVDHVVLGQDYQFWVDWDPMPDGQTRKLMLVWPPDEIEPLEGE
jgi:hypothetical protein